LNLVIKYESAGPNVPLQNSGINTPYVQKLSDGNVKYALTFADENAKYIRTPPAKKQTTTGHEARAAADGSLTGRIVDEQRRGKPKVPFESKAWRNDDDQKQQDEPKSALAKNPRFGMHKKSYFA
jgi:hypothetical protein